MSESLKARSRGGGDERGLRAPHDVENHLKQELSPALVVAWHLAGLGVACALILGATVVLTTTLRLALL